MAAAPSITFESLSRDIRREILMPVYILYGEEGYYIDKLVNLFESLVPEEERDFNLTNIYAPEISPEAIGDACRRYPVMADRQIVIVREAQAVNANSIDKLSAYASHPTETTVLVIVMRGSKDAKGKNLVAAVKKNGIVFESKKLTDRTIGTAISSLVKERGLNIDQKGLMMMRDYVGTDLSRLYNEIEKLAVALPPGASVTPEVIERNIGISKDYNNFELIDAIAGRNAAKAFSIVKYFASNPKNNPTVVTVSTIFNFFSNLLVFQFSPDRSKNTLMEALGFRNEWQLRRFEDASRMYNARQTIEIISAIRRMDAMSKGVGSRMNQYDLLHDLIFHILSARGDVIV